MIVSVERSGHDRVRRHPCLGTALAGMLLLAAGACEGVTRRSFAVRDSAGVPIVESVRPRLAGESGWQVDAMPSVRVGRDTAVVRFRQITGVVGLDNGGIAVADGGDFTLRFFDGSGRLTRTVQPGDAPVMPRAVTRLYRVGGELFLAQRGLEPTLVFDQAGEYLRAVDPPPIEGTSFIAQFQVMADGSVLAIRPPQGLLPRRTVTWTENAVFIRITPDGRHEPVLSVPAIEFARIPSGIEAVIFGPVLAFAFGENRLFAGFPQRYDIGEYTPDGALLRRLRRDWEPVAVEEAMVETVRGRLLAMLDSAGLPDEPELREYPESQIGALTAARTLPAHGRMLLDRAGNLWVERVPPLPIVPGGPYPVRNEPTPWDVFDAEGVWAVSVETPPNVYVTYIGDTGLAGIRRDAGIESAVLFPLNRGPAASDSGEGAAPDG